MARVEQSSILGEISRARSITDSLFSQVLPKAIYDRPLRERHRIVFYIGHLEAFDWNLLGKGVLGAGPITEELDSLFAFGIDPSAGQLPDDEATDWPNVSEVRRYVGQVRRNLEHRIPQIPEHAIRIALEHRLMHAETLTYLIHNLPYTRRMTRTRRVYSRRQSPPLQFIQIPAGIATLGRARGEGFGWDNEYDLHTKQVEAFAVSKYKVTNDQYLEFVNDGGPAPHYWMERSGKWRYRGFDGEIPLPGDLPVFVSYLQADAYARWSGKALPTEAQFHRAAFGSPSGTERQYPWGSDYPREEHGNFGFRLSDLVPVTANPSGDSAFGVSQLTGNGWEWTASRFAPFPGFKPEPLYPGYSANFFDGEHYVVKGASSATDHVFLRRSFRNWFRDYYGYAYTTFRLVEN